MTTPRVEFATLDDIPAPIALQRRVYPTISPWTQAKLEQQLTVFSQGQIVARAGGDVIGYAGSLIVSWDQWADAHTWKEITASGSFQTHDPRGRTLYGAEVFVAPEAQGSGVGHLLYEARRTLCRAMNLKRIIACGRLPGYRERAESMSAEDYAKRVVWGDYRDPVLSFQLHEGFSYCGVIEGYLPEDVESGGYASVIVWLNPDHDPSQPTEVPKVITL